MNPHKLLLASAGTGKTYRLTGRFLQLLVAGVPPERILATTFTRKAAGEILDRVLKRLVEAAEDPKKRAELDTDVGGGPRSAQEYRTLLAGLVRHIDRFRVLTLDAFFVQLGHLYALELGFPCDWDIAEEVDDRAMRRAAVGVALASADRDQWLTLLRDLQRADASKRIEQDLLDLAAEGRDAYLDSAAEAWGVVQPPAELPEEERREAERRLAALELPKTKKGDPVQHWVNSKTNALDCLERADWAGFLDIGLVKKLLAGEERFSRHEIGADVHAAFDPLLRQAAHALIGRIAVENAALYNWLERFENAYESVKRDERAFRFEDVPQKLAPRDEEPFDEQELDLWYRLDGKIDHLLLDEFQDTSSVQWRILRPVAEEILADGTGERSFFCVGDVKQSIYGWRSAEPRLLKGLEHHPLLAGVAEPLSKNWRSSQIVLDAVNRIFGDVGSSAVFAEKSSHREAAETWQESYREHRAAESLPGEVVLLRASEKGEDERAYEPALRMAADRTAAISAEAPRATIGILLRKNNHLTKLIYLLGERGLRASGEGGNPLTDSSAVLHVVSLLHLTDHPGDGMAALHVVSSPLATAFDWPARKDTLASRARQVARDARARIAAEGFGGLCAWLRPTVHAGYDDWDRRRFEQLVDLAYAFDTRARTRADDFVDAVRETKVEDPASTRIKVLTIHMAKGLEFDAVILPELNEPLYRHEGLLKVRPEPAGLFTEVSKRSSSDVRALDPNLVRMNDEVEKSDLTESLCLLYVAVTRAKYRLDLIVQAGKPRSNWAGLLLEKLAGESSAGPAGVVWEHPDNVRPWLPVETGDVAESGAEDLTRTAAPVAFRASSEPRGLPRRAPSGQEGDGTVRGEEFLRLRDSRARVRGKLVHRWLEEVEWLEDFALDEPRLLALTADLEPDEDARREHLREFAGRLEQPALRGLLTRSAQGVAADVGLEVWRERPFSMILPAGDGEPGEVLWSGAFDRVVVHRRGDEVVCAEVIDYKTDEVDAEGLEQRAAFYRPQLQAYRRVTAELLGVDASLVTCRTAFLALDSIVDG